MYCHYFGNAVTNKKPSCCWGRCITAYTVTVAVGLLTCKII